MNELLKFSNRAEFRAWMEEHYLTNGGACLLFGKSGGPKTIWDAKTQRANGKNG